MITSKKHILFIVMLFVCNWLGAQSLEWVKTFGGPGSGRGNCVTTDLTGNVYVVGSFAGIVDFDPGPEIQNLTAQGNNDNYIQKFDTDGNLIWSKSFGGPGEDHAGSIATDNSGNLYIVGIFYETVDFDPGSGITNLTTTDRDVYILKLNTDGDLLWVRSIEGNGYNDHGISIAVDESGNNYIKGYFEFTVDFDPGIGTYFLTAGAFTHPECFILKLDTDGDFLWVKAMGGYSFNNSNSIAVDQFENVYTISHFHEPTDLDPGAATYNVVSEGYSDINIQKLDINGDFVWGKAFGGPYLDYSHGITVDASGNVYTTGIFFETVDFDAGDGVYELTSQGERDVFVQKLSTNGDFLWTISFGGVSGDTGHSIIADAAGNVYTSGTYYYTVDFDPGDGIYNLTALPHVPNAFIQKLDTHGEFQWTTTFNGSSSSFSVAVDPSGGVYTTGNFSGTVDFDPPTGDNTVSASTVFDSYISKVGVMTLAVADKNAPMAIAAFPNPSNGEVQLHLQEEVYFADLILTDIQGRVIFKKFYNSLSNTSLTLPDAPGVYIVALQTNEKKSVVKLIRL